MFEIEDPTSPSIERKIMKKIELVFPPPSPGDAVLESPVILIGGVPFSFRIRDENRMYNHPMYQYEALQFSIFNHSSKKQRISVTHKKVLLAEDAVIFNHQEKSLGPLNFRGKGKRKLEMTVTLQTKEREIWTR